MEELDQIDAINNIMLEDPEANFIYQAKKTVLVNNSETKHFNNKHKEYFIKIKDRNRELMKEQAMAERKEAVVKFTLHILSNVFNLFAIVLYVVENNFNSEERKSFQDRIDFLELILAFFFTLEYFLILTRVRQKMKYVFSFDSFIDIFTTIPIYISYFSFSLVDTNFIRIFRIFRIFRILRFYKTFKYIQSDSLMSDEAETPDSTFDLDMLKLQILTIMVVLISFFFIGAGLVLVLQDLLESPFSEEMNFLSAFYFVVITFTSIGYGDILPTHPVSRLTMVVGLVVIIGIISDQLGKLAALLSKLGPGLLCYKGKGHIIVITDKTVNLEAFLIQLKEKFAETDIVIISKEISELPSKEYPYDRCNLIFATIIDLEIFQRSNLREADRVFIFCKKSVYKCKQKEKLIDFVLLKIARYRLDVPVCIQSLYAKEVYGSHRGNKKNIEAMCIVPIMRVKCMIMAKSTFNPGFAAFAQNLMFNEYHLEIDRLRMPPLQRAYAIGCEYKILVKDLPPKLPLEFAKLCRFFYAFSIRKYHSKVLTDSTTANRPILLLGFLDGDTLEEGYSFLPREQPSNKGSYKGIFIAYEPALDEAIEHLHKRRSSNINNVSGATLMNVEEEKKGITRQLIKSFHKGKTMVKAHDTRKITRKKASVLEFTMQKKKNSEMELQERCEKKTETHKQTLFSGLHTRNPSENNSIKAFLEGPEDTESKGFCEPVVQMAFPKPIFEEEDDDISVDYSEGEGNIFNEMKLSNVFEAGQSRIGPTMAKSQKEVLSAELEEMRAKTTRENLMMMERVENKANSVESIMADIRRQADSRYHISKYTEKEKREFLFEKRIINLEKTEIEFSHHILIIGTQGQLYVLIKMLSMHYSSRMICIMTEDDEDKELVKLIKIFTNLFVLKGDSLNPAHLEKAGINQAEFTLALVENVDKQNQMDLKKVMTYRAIEYFYNASILMESWSIQSTKFLSFLPVDGCPEIEANEFFNPNFMRGSLLYMDCFEKVAAKAATQEPAVESWMRLLSCGYVTSQTSMSGRSSINRVSHLPVILTVDVPDKFIKREWFQLAAQLIKQKDPVIPLGIYVSDPLAYSGKKVQGKIISRATSRFDELKIMTSHKNKIRSSGRDNEENAYFSYLQVLKRCSKNGKHVTDYIHWKNSHIPLFITNPPPNLVLEKGTKILIMTNREFLRSDNKIFSKKDRRPSETPSVAYKNELSTRQSAFMKVWGAIKDKYEEEFEQANREERMW